MNDSGKNYTKIEPRRNRKVERKMSVGNAIIKGLNFSSL